MTSQDLKVEKFHLKEMALEVQGKGKIDRTRFLKAKAFLNELLENDLFENDYFVYRRLAMLYSDNKYFDEEYQIIKSFFKSGIYAHNYHFLWFRNKFRRLVEKKIATEDELDELVKYYKEHYLKNKHKQNNPTFIAERIIKKRGSITTISESDYNQNQFRFELVETAEECRRLGKYDEAIEIYNDLIFNKKRRHFKFYQRLAALYRKTGKKEEEINITMNI